MYLLKDKRGRSAGGLNKSHTIGNKNTHTKKTIKLKQMTPFQKASKGSVSLMESSFLWTIWQRVAPLFSSFCLNGHADSDMIFHIKGAKRSETGCKTSIKVIRSCVASRP